MNLFIDLHEAKFGTRERRFGTGWENLFTEQLAFFLAADFGAARAVAQMLLGGRETTVTELTTQANLTDGIPDLRIRLGDGTHLHVEHKFDAALGPRQLQRYLGNGRVALVSRCAQTVPQEVLNSSDYLRPSDRHYFNWVDVYEALPLGQHAPPGFGALRDHFRGYMRELGLAPSALTSEWRRLFEDRTDVTNQSIQKDFGRLLDPVKSFLCGKGFKVANVSHMGKQAYAPAGAWWRHLYVQPGRVRADYLGGTGVEAFDPGYEGLVVELVCDDRERGRAQAAYHTIRPGFTDSAGHAWFALAPRPLSGKKRLRLSLATPLAPFLRGQPDSREVFMSASQALNRLLVAAEDVARAERPGR